MRQSNFSSAVHLYEFEHFLNNKVEFYLTFHFEPSLAKILGVKVDFKQLLE